MPKKDLNQLAKFLIDQATGDIAPVEKSAAATLGKLGGKARAAKLTKEQLVESAKKANAARWAKKPTEADVKAPPKNQQRRGVIRPAED
jgi:hypothetical protein